MIAATESTVESPLCLALEALSCRRGERMLFQDFNLRVSSGEVVQLHGANGSGKTTLIRAICGLIPVESGRVLWRGTPREATDEAFLADMSYLGHLPGLKRDLSAGENLALTSALTAAPGGVDPRTALRRVGLTAYAKTPLRQLSAGQTRRVALARLLVAPTPLWLLDEPLTALDADGRSLLEQLVGTHAEAGGLVLIATHQTLTPTAGTSRDVRLDAA